MATTVVPTGSRAALPAVRGRAGFGGTLRSEFTKIRSVRSTLWSLAIFVILSLGLTALLSWLTVHNIENGHVGRLRFPT